MKYVVGTLLSFWVFLLIGGAAYAESEAKEITDTFNEIDAAASILLGEVADYNVPAQFQCPPAIPNKKDTRAELSTLSRRYNVLNTRTRALRNRNNLLGRAGEGQIGDRFRHRVKIVDEDGNLGLNVDLERRENPITDDQFANLQKLLDGIRDALRQHYNAVRAAPPPDRECDPTKDPIRAVTLTPSGAVEPGATANVSVTASASSGKAITITKVTVTGVEAMAEAGASPAYTINGLGTANATIVFDVAKIRADRGYPITVTIEGRPVGVPGPGFTTGRQNTNITVKNVAPTITSAAFSFSVKPGEQVSLDGEIVIVDRNADDKNVNEIDRNRVRLMDHPDDLKTLPFSAFSRFSSKRQTAFDPSKGEYTFKVKREANVERPHAHGVFTPIIRVFDRGTPQLNASQPVSITVENVAPQAWLRPTPRDGFHSNDGIPVGLVGMVRDDNGADDIEDITINASAAGGGTYALARGTIVRTTSDENGFSFKINPDTFAHTRNSGLHRITAVAEDGKGPNDSPPNKTAFETAIHVGNDAPEIGAIGYMTGTETIILKEVCPRDLITVGAQVSDREGDTVKVSATILPGGTPEELKKQNPNDRTHTLIMLAPATPGEYRIIIQVEELDTNEKKKASTATTNRELILKVLPCGDEEKDPPGIAMDPPPPINVAIGGLPPGGGIKIVPQPPALPGEPNTDAAIAVGLSELLGNSWLIDTIMGVDPASEESMTQTAIGTIVTPLLEDYVAQTPGLEHHSGVVPEGEFICVGSVYKPPVMADPFNPVKAIEDLFALNDEIETLVIDLATGGPTYEAWFLADSLNLLSNEFGDRVPMYQEGSVVPRKSNEANQNAIDAERNILQNQADALKQRKDAMEAVRDSYEEQLETAINAGNDAEIDRLRGVLNDLTEVQEAIAAESTPVFERLNQLEADIIAGRADESSAIAQEINDAAWTDIAEAYGFNTDVQDAKQWTNWVTRWVSVGSEVSYGNDRLVRMSELSLVSAEVKLDIVDGLLEDAEVGSFRETVLNRTRSQLATQRDSAQQHLDSLSAITGAGFVIDGVLYATGGVVVNAGKKIIVGGASKALGTRAATATANTLDSSVIQLTKQVTGRSSASGAGASAGSAAARESTESVVSSSSDILTDAFGAGQPNLDMAVNQAAIDFAQNPTAAGFRAAVADAGLTPPVRGADVTPQWGAMWVNFADDVLPGIVGSTDDIIFRSADEVFDASATIYPLSSADDPYWAAYRALEDAGLRGRQAFNSPEGQRIAQYWDDFFKNLAASPDRAAALRTAQDIAGERGLQRFLKELREQVMDDMFEGNSDFFGLTPIFLLPFLQDGASEAPSQAKADSLGRVSLQTAKAHNLFSRSDWGDLGLSYDIPASDSFTSAAGLYAFGTGTDISVRGLGNPTDLRVGDRTVHYYTPNIVGFDASVDYSTSLFADPCWSKKGGER